MTAGTYGVIYPGGTTLGAYQVPFAEAFPDAAWYAGGSVGALTAAFSGSGRAEDLRPIWIEVGQTGTRWFQRMQLAIWKGLFVLDPLRAKLREHRVGVGGFSVPTYAGAVRMRDKQYETVALNGLPVDDAHDALVVSCLQPMIHRPERFRGAYYADAGVRNVIPAWPKGAPAVDRLIVVCPSPIEEAHRFHEEREEDVSSAVEQGLATVGAFMGNTVLADVRERIEEARLHGCSQVDFYAPKTWADVSRPFRATPETIALRLASGERDLAAGPRLSVRL